LASAASGEVIRIEFSNLPYPNGHNVTNEWEEEGIIFTADGNGMDPNFPCVSLGVQENLVQSGVLYNLFRINFVADAPVVDVICEFLDQNGKNQIHGLYELDENLNILQSVTYDDAHGAEFSLHLANPDGMFGIAACEQPYGAERFKAIEFTTRGGCGENATLSVKCPKDGKKVKAKLKKADPNTEVVFALDGDQKIPATTNRRGKAKVKWTGQEPGSHTVTVCDLEEDC